MRFHTAMVTALLVTVFAVAASAQGDSLFAKTHRGAKESKVASDWYEKLPVWAHSLVSKNQFIQTHLPMEFVKDKLRPMRQGVNKFEIRDANERAFRAFLLAPQGVDGNGLPVYEATELSDWVSWKTWPARYIVESYPVESNPDVNDVVALGAWLYVEKENQLANQVLAVAHDMDRDLAPLIQAYICEKEKWDMPSEGLVEWGHWDMEYQKERTMLVTPAARDQLLADREKQAKQQWDQLTAARGDYRGKPPRRRSPTQQLVRIEWDFKQFKIAYQNSEFLKDTKRQEEMQLILDSIKDDLALLNENRKKARDMGATGNANDIKEQADFLETLLRIDPMDVTLRAEVADAWFKWGEPDQYGNGCARVQGMKNAIPHYAEVLKAYPFSTAFLLRMGQCYQAQEDSTNARKYYQQVLDIAGVKGHGQTAQALMRNMDVKDQGRAKKAGR